MGAMHPNTARAAKRILSARERALIALLANGRTYAQAAETLGITTKTAHNYRDRVVRKLNADSTANAIVRAREMGVL